MTLAAQGFSAADEELVVATDVIEDASPIVDDLVVDSPPPAPARDRRTLGCQCETPTPGKPGSALCGGCGLIYLTAEEYGEHLARCRAEARAMGAGIRERDTRPSESAERPLEPAGVEPDVEVSAPDAAEAEGSRRWWRRRGKGRDA